MSTIQPGTITSVDLTVPNADEVRDFYERVIGWKHKPLDMGDYNDYFMTAPDEQPVSGICHKRGMNAALPSQWMVYFTVQNLEASVQEVEQRSGQVIVRPSSSEGTRFAVIQDPAGAVCALYEIGEDAQAEMVAQIEKAQAAATQPGRLAWVDLTVDDAESVRDFYQHVIGWTPQAVEQEGYNDYNMCSADGNARTGICHKRGMNATLPSQWMTYFVVPDLDASLNAAEAGGGTVIVPRRGGGDGGMAVIQDPAGAVCSLFQVG